jgi:hypothetical protein
MFFYLLKNASLFDFEKPNNSTNKNFNDNRNIKILIYGTLSYILSHALIVYSTLNSIHYYFWLILILDCLTMYLIYTTQKNGAIYVDDNVPKESSINYDSEYEVNNIIDQFNKDL